jgi:lysyl-tRNA synthetase class 2
MAPMSLVPKSNWQPTASAAHLKLRMDLYAAVRAFMAGRGVQEVETPLLAHATVTDTHIDSFATRWYAGEGQQTLYLQTSPEYAMKRLLAHGYACIFQISKAFRNEPCSRWHNPEFTMLEWYRVGYDFDFLITEVHVLVTTLMQLFGQRSLPPLQRFSYQALFQKFVGIDPLSTSVETLQALAQAHNIAPCGELMRDDWLALLLTHLIEPQLKEFPALVIDGFPATQAALAKLNPDDHRTAQRFEYYLNGIELANGYDELGDAQQLSQRFKTDLAERAAAGKEQVAIDETFLSAMRVGLPSCVGVALGLDRLLMAISQTDSISATLTFSTQVA